MQRSFVFALLMGACSIGRCCLAATLFLTADFQDGTTNGWAGGAAPTNIPAGGPDGAADAYLQITSTGGIGPGSRLATRNITPAWTGDYAAAGVQRIAFHALNSAGQILSLRAVINTASNLRWTSTTAAMLPPDGVWHRLEFSLLESQLTLVGGVGSYDDVIQNVSRLILRHDEGTPSAEGTPIAATLGIDNVTLLPGGDFDANGALDGSDVDALVAAIAAANNPSQFDLTGDAAVNSADLQEWLRLGGELNLGLGRSYLPGDANLDGNVDEVDFQAWTSNKFTQMAAWTLGDFNADGFIDGRDVLLWNSNKFMSGDDATVPEPAVAWLVVWGGWLARRRSAAMSNR